MEKAKPSFQLAAFRAVCGDVRRLTITTTAVRTAAEIGFGRSEIAAAVREVKPADFHKSMTSYADHRRWQDVYHVPHEAMTL